jgi:hypothetical protein
MPRITLKQNIHSTAAFRQPRLLCPPHNAHNFIACPLKLLHVEGTFSLVCLSVVPILGAYTPHNHPQGPPPVVEPYAINMLFYNDL